MVFDMGTHCYVGSLACGCGCAVVADWPSHTQHTAKDVADLITQGLSVQRLPHEEVQAAFSAKCARYPHEGWQRRIEAARSGVERAQGEMFAVLDSSNAPESTTRDKASS